MFAGQCFSSLDPGAFRAARAAHRTVASGRWRGSSDEGRAPLPHAPRRQSRTVGLAPRRSRRVVPPPERGSKRPGRGCGLPRRGPRRRDGRYAAEPLRRRGGGLPLRGHSCQCRSGAVRRPERGAEPDRLRWTVAAHVTANTTAIASGASRCKGGPPSEREERQCQAWGA